MFSHIHRVCGHMFDTYIKWQRENSKNAKFSDADAKKVRPLCKACVYGEDRQTSTDRHRVHRPLPTIAGQCFVVDAFASGHTSQYLYPRCDARPHANAFTTKHWPSMVGNGQCRCLPVFAIYAGFA